METSASCEARSAPSSYPTTEGTTLSKQGPFPQPASAVPHPLKPLCENTNFI